MNTGGQVANLLIWFVMASAVKPTESKPRFALPQAGLAFYSLGGSRR